MNRNTVSGRNWSNESARQKLSSSYNPLPSTATRTSSNPADPSITENIASSNTARDLTRAYSVPVTDVVSPDSPNPTRPEKPLVINPLPSPKPVTVNESAWLNSSAAV